MNKNLLGISLWERFTELAPHLQSGGFSLLEFRIKYGDERKALIENLKYLQKAQEDYSFRVKTIHISNEADYDVSLLDDEKSELALKKQLELIDISAQYLKYAEIVVVHPCHGFVPEDEYEDRIEKSIIQIKKICEHCKTKNLKVAIENLTEISNIRTSKDLLRIIEAVGDNIGVCYDVNHLFFESPEDFIENTKNYLITMHVSDNDGEHERHWWPGDGCVDFDTICRKLREINYQGLINFEVDAFRYPLPSSVQKLYERWSEISDREG
ncbi:MAG: sugar phosphate isomerase/epimerase [Ruminococcaceae bacterium]|nr:sugar phosphate isomerase/epimerase [Oscillospiraceae bacterium]